MRIVSLQIGNALVANAQKHLNAFRPAPLFGDETEQDLKEIGVLNSNEFKKREAKLHEVQEDLRVFIHRQKSGLVVNAGKKELRQCTRNGTLVHA